MDLCAGARRLWIMTDHIAKSGESKLVESCIYPLTGLACVSRIYTNLAVLDVTPKGFELVEMVPGMTVDELQAITGAKIHPAPSLAA